MRRLILTTNDSGAGNIGAAGLAEFVITLGRRLVWGAPLSELQLGDYFAARTTQGEGLHWQDDTPAWRLERAGGQDFSLIDFCARYNSVELWVDPDPNAQLNLIWLLDFLRGHQPLASAMELVQADFEIGNRLAEDLAKWQPTRVNITRDQLETASAAWQAHRASTPQAWSDLLARDMSALPRLRQTIVELLGELPWRMTGLSATEMWMLEFIAHGEVTPVAIFTELFQRDQRGAFGYWEIGELLDNLAHCAAPVVAGLAEGPFTLEMHDDRERHRRYNKSKLSLTALGKAILAGAEDFARHNPIHRWWGGTELTNDRLWRWDATSKTLIAP